MVLRAFLFLIGERKVPLFIRFIVEIPLLVTVYSNFTGATLWVTVLLWQANRRGAGGERKAPLQAALHDSSAGSSFLSRGLTRRLRRGSGTCRSMGRSIALGGDPKGVQGGERKALLLAALGNNFAVSKSPGGE